MAAMGAREEAGEGEGGDGAIGGGHAFVASCFGKLGGGTSISKEGGGGSAGSDGVAGSKGAATVGGKGGAGTAA